MLDLMLSQWAGLRAFIVCRTEPHPTKPGRMEKIPCDVNGYNVDSQDPRQWLLPEEAAARARAEGRYVGIVLHETLGVFCVDIDHCATRDAAGNLIGWTQQAHDLCAKFPGAGVEISQSGEALHVFGRHHPIPKHRVRKKTVPGLEVYTRSRFIMLTGTSYSGDVRTEHTAAVQAVIAQYFPEPPAPEGGEWTDGPYEGWRGGGTDEQIIHAMRNRRTVASAFGNGVSFADLWDANADKLSQAFPPDANSHSGLAWNGSSADQALANHLAYATGYDCERTLQLMFQSGLRRDKWERHDNYMVPTILRAIVGKREEAEERARNGRVLIERKGETFDYAPAPPPPPAPAPPPPPARTVTVAYSDASGGITTGGVLFAPPPPPPPAPPAPPAPVTEAPAAPAGTVGKIPRAGEHVFASDFPVVFEGNVYVEDVHRIILDTGVLVEQKQFNARHGGRSFQMTVDGKATDDAWDCYISNKLQCLPRADTMTFDPKLAPGHLIQRDGLTCFNSYVPINIPMQPGDVSPFVNHIRKLWPHGNDANIVIAYFAALVKHKGFKFAWAVLLQGVPGNGKTFLSKALEYCVGQRYTHHARAKDLGSNFNQAFYGKLLVCIEDVHISESKSSVWEALKPMITAERMEIEGKGTNQVNRDVCFNFIMDSNHKGALRKTADDRRIAPFFAAQQSVGDLLRAGLDDAYFIRLWDWAQHEGGFAIIAHYLSTYEIPDALNPAGGCRRAPRTTSTDAAIVASRGSIEQEVIEAIDSGAAGFRDGWVSSVAFDQLLTNIGRAKALPRENRKQLLMDLGYELHPGLPGGRVLQTLSDGSRPLLYVKPEHASYRLDGTQATAMYVNAQAPRK